MNAKNLRKAISHIKGLRDEMIRFRRGKYEGHYSDKYIVGNISKNGSYVQFIPTLLAYYYDSDGKVTKMDMTNQDLRKLPVSMKNQMMGKPYNYKKNRVS